MAPGTQEKLAEVPWSLENHHLTWALISELESLENYKVLFGKKDPSENTSGDTKAAVYRMIKIYKTHAAKLHRTGGGLCDRDAEDGSDEYLDFYIPPGGPTEVTEDRAWNIWKAINAEWLFFSQFHKILAICPNVTPIAVTTGTGLNGMKTLYMQPPSPHASAPGVEAQREHLHALLLQYGQQDRDLCDVSFKH
ncbi:hypothetical protein OE88DRAFT_1733055 [Heliocybe sulcata]|uniref:Uncharacterized protein n=1 Tax=Heliocybe sulcata TaxID=5364 RepID=A0A5C3NAP1_9AGAM|nr:hypothetical protein OE88DRAFT_1733055 [Heliocybe sulcata]